MGKIYLILLACLFAELVSASDLVIVEVKRNIPLADSDPVYKDFYIQQNSARDLKKNSQVVVKRKLIIRDTASKTIGEVETVVGILKIISSDNKVAVGREIKLISRDNEAMLDQPYIMVGDYVDSSASTKDYAQTTTVLKNKVARLPASLKPATENPEKNTHPAVVTPPATTIQPAIIPTAPATSKATEI